MVKIPFTTVGKSGLALAFVGSMTAPDQVFIGAGSDTAVVGDTALGSLAFGNGFSSSDDSVVRFVEFISDFGATTLSGTSIAELGVVTSGASYDLWNREAFTPISFDGTNELQVSVNFEVF